MLQRPQLLTPLSLRDDQQVLETLARSIDKSYTTIDSTFSQAKMHEVPRPGRLSSGRGLGPGRWSIEVRDVYMVPFDLSSTEHAVWNVISDSVIHHVRHDRNGAVAVRPVHTDAPVTFAVGNGSQEELPVHVPSAHWN
jgi:hypothetical protein